MQKPLKPCATPGCPELTREFYCTYHKQKAEKRRAERDKYYDRHVRDKKSREFYKSQAWERLRLRALTRDSFLCQECLKNQKLTRANLVHHIRPIREHWDERLKLENLVSLCHTCHNRVHGGYGGGVGGG